MSIYKGLGMATNTPGFTEGISTSLDEKDIEAVKLLLNSKELNENDLKMQPMMTKPTDGASKPKLGR